MYACVRACERERVMWYIELDDERVWVCKRPDYLFLDSKWIFEARSPIERQRTGPDCPCVYTTIFRTFYPFYHVAILFFTSMTRKMTKREGWSKCFFFLFFSLSLSLSLSLRLPLLVRHETSPKRNGRFNFPMWTFERVERWSVYNVVCFFLSLRKEKRREKKGKERKRRVKEREGCSEKGKRSILVFFFERTYSLAVYRFISIFYHTRVYTTSIARIHVQSLCDPREEYNFSRVSYTVCMCFFFSVALRIQLCNEKNVFRENNYRRLIDFFKNFFSLFTRSNV